MNKVFGLLGLAKRAGKVICGESGVKNGIRYFKSQLVIIAEDASENTAKSITDSCKYYGVPYYFYSTKDELGHAVGHEFHACVAISDKGFSDSIEKCLQANINGGE